MGKRRGVGAALLAAGLVLSGCASGDGQDQTTTTTSAVAQHSDNPWDLPLERRPPLFDPCAEIPVEAVGEALGKSVEPFDEAMRHDPDSLMSCSWTSDEVIFGVLSTWKSREEYLADKSFQVNESVSKVPGRTGLLLTEPSDNSDSTCIQSYFTSLGTVMVILDMTTGLSEFKGARFVKACDALSESIAPIMPFIPEGKF